MTTATSSSSTTAATALSFLLGGATTLALSFWFHRHALQNISVDAEERRREERTGRIRAEVKLRQLWKEKTALEMKVNSKGNGTTSTNEYNSKGQQSSSEQRQQQQDQIMILQCIGTVVSPYTKRMGTPRQGSLVPSSRAFIQLNIPTQALEGIEAYSHLWVVFAFHANTNVFHKKTKVRPPRATGNQKVGQLATRSPHRPNPLGLSLVKIERLDPKAKRLHISGLDLVNGTPVYDVKPCVPWDIPGYVHTGDNPSPVSQLRVPEWVGQDDVIEKVLFTEEALVAFQTLVVRQRRLAPLYNGPDDLSEAKATLIQILAQDPRSSHRGLKTNQRGTTTDENEVYSLVFGKLQVGFQVLSWGVQVVQVAPADFDEDAYVEGIPLISEAQDKKKQTSL